LNVERIFVKLVSILLILFTVTTNAAAQIMLKHGMQMVGEVKLDGAVGHSALNIVTNIWVLLGLATFVVSMASHLVVLSRVELSFAYPFLSLAYIMVAAYAYFVFGENVGALRLAGYALICAGTLLVALS
jgi:multidrug transporter EmrE-like cation transporter